MTYVYVIPPLRGIYHIILKFIISHRSLYAYLGKIACALSVVPMHSADCERGFSALGRVKTKLRSRLTNKSLLIINLEGPELNDFDFNSTIQKWASI